MMAGTGALLTIFYVKRWYPTLAKRSTIVTAFIKTRSQTAMLGVVSMRVRKAVIPAAGLGTRFLPATKAQPKEMLPIVDKPTIQYIIEEAIASGIEDVLIITGRNKRSIEDHFDKSVELELSLARSGKEDLLHLVEDIANMTNIHYIRQKEPLGLGHAVYCARTFVCDEPFAVMLGDDIVAGETPCLKQLMDVYNDLGGSVIGVQDVMDEDVSRYGIVKGTMVSPGICRVETMVEKPSLADAPSRSAIMGRYVISPSIFSILERTQPGKGGEVQLTDALVTLAHKEPVFSYNFKGTRYDVGNKLGYLQANIEFGLSVQEIRDDFAQYLIALADGLRRRKKLDTECK